MKRTNLARPRVQAMEAYSTPPEGRRKHKDLLLDANECSTPPSPATRLAFEDTADLHRYPEYEGLASAVARYAGVATKEVLITNGSDHAIDVVFRTFTDPGSKAVIPAPSFAVFYQAAKLAGNEILKPLYDLQDLSFPVDEVLAAAKTSPQLIVICNPNNPTGTLITTATIERIARSAPRTIILVDEAYFEFADVTAIPLITRYPNIVVTRTFSKAFGLAALRIGYVVASTAHITEMLKVCGPYRVNLPASHAALAALANLSETKEYTREVMVQSKPMLEEFLTKHAVPFYPSAANFVLLRPHNPKEIYEALRHHGILVRPMHGHPIQGTIRVSIGTTQETEQFIATYAEIMKTQGPAPVIQA